MRAALADGFRGRRRGGGGGGGGGRVARRVEGWSKGVGTARLVFLVCGRRWGGGRWWMGWDGSRVGFGVRLDVGVGAHY